ncbi:MAG: hypothetical protein K2X39_00565 [Silvanigrellaceae bacterium]|nr:hypothetical protein [Silvanigrellaceae bacterium]
MSKIVLLAKEIKNELSFIKKLKQLTGKSISDIRNSLNNKKPFYAGMWTGNTSEGDIEILKQILKFTKNDGDKIRLFHVNNEADLNEMEDAREITREIFANMLQADEETARYLEELDEEMHPSEES